MNDQLKIKVKKLHPAALLPTQAKLGDAGYDIYSLERVIINPLERKPVKTGIALEIPKGYFIRVAPRSGLAVKNGIDVMAGVIDEKYTGEIIVVLINLAAYAENVLRNSNDPYKHFFGSDSAFIINPGDKIAQLIIQSRLEASFEQVESLTETERGNKGFGSTGN